jgi:hypothetical protein
LVRQGKLKAKREGKNWLIHGSLSAEIAEAEKPPCGTRMEVYEKLEETRKAAEDAGESHDMIAMQLTRQFEQNQRVLEFHQEPYQP